MNDDDLDANNKMTLADLRDGLIAAFSLQELSNLCFDLDVRNESIPGDTIDAKAQGLVAYCQRRRRLPDLVQRLQTLRPTIKWAVPVDAPLIDAAEPDAAVLSACQEMVTQIVDRVLAVGERMSGKAMSTTSVPVLSLDDVRPYDAGLEAMLAVFREGGCAKLSQVAMPIISERQAAAKVELTRLLARQRSHGIQAPLALRLQIVQIHVQIGLLNLLTQIL